MIDFTLLLDSWRNVKRLLISKDVPSDIKDSLKIPYDLLTQNLLNVLYSIDCKILSD